MKALLLIAHGSRLKSANNEIVRLAEQLKIHCSEQYRIIHAGFLEFTEDLIPESIKKCVDDGATSIVVLPYFLHSGRHVSEDIPNKVNETKKRYPEVEIEVAVHIGASEMMFDLLINSANIVK